MSINPAALEKVRTATMRGESFVTVLESLAKTMLLTGAAESSLTLDYRHKDIQIKDGDLIPIITIGLRQVSDAELIPMKEEKSEEKSAS